MKKHAGFNLIELILSLGLLSVVLTVFLKLKSLEHHRTQSFLEEQDLLAYMDVLDWTLQNTNGIKIGTWFGWQEANTKERKFTRNHIKDYVCCAEIKEENELYTVTLYGNPTKKVRTKPIKYVMLKEL